VPRPPDAIPGGRPWAADRAGRPVLFVDYAGTTLAVIDASTGEAMTAQLFVAVLGASNYTYAEATWTQGLSDWIGSHTRTFAFIGGIPAMVVSDNLRSGVTKACFYERHTAGKAEILHAGFRGEAARKPQDGVFQNCLDRRCNVHVLLLEPGLGIARRPPEQRIEPLVRHGEPGAVVEIIEVEAE